MGLFYNPPNPNIGGQQPLESKKLTPPQSGPAPQNPPVIGSRVSVEVLACWAAAAVIATASPPYLQVEARLSPPVSGPVLVTPRGSSGPQAVLNSWLPADPAPIVAINLDPPIAGPTPQNPPLIGSQSTAPALIAGSLPDVWVSTETNL